MDIYLQKFCNTPKGEQHLYGKKLLILVMAFKYIIWKIFLFENVIFFVLRSITLFKNNITLKIMWKKTLLLKDLNTSFCFMPWHAQRRLKKQILKETKENEIIFFSCLKRVWVCVCVLRARVCVCVCVRICVFVCVFVYYSPIVGTGSKR